ncbi:hypothetical protein [Allokutzneria sp. NRRL B-24872]|uniref:hypothetical protein n=1 Tax=Allokutzneria sp. NRRL B-24872 TaxID=1137961 RepID=UPI000A3C93A1|nr:hypothetical protein [Allokutzneria sp. NRRL B-24872]
MTAQPVPAATARASAWAVAADRDFGGTVGDLVRARFPAHARVFHPAHRAGAPVRWSEVAAASGRAMHPLAQWAQLNPPSPGETARPEQWGSDLRPIRARTAVWDEEPVLGSMPTTVAAELVSVLTGHTRTPGRCWFAVWDGYGALSSRWRAAPSFELFGRDLLLLSGSIASAAFPLSDKPFEDLYANMWWPSDHAWCVATDVDMMTTYVGGSVEAVEALLRDDVLEALPAAAEHSVRWDSDVVNLARP